MNTFFDATAEMRSISLADLMKAREDNYAILTTKDNVVATAVGYYRIRKQEPRPTEKDPHPDTSPYKKIPRTLENSEVRSYSWPAILVFVRTWVSEKDIYTKDSDQLLPKSLAIQGGRQVPVCVIEAGLTDAPGAVLSEDSLNFPRNLISGGYPIIADVQYLRRIASVGCIVSDGHLFYALTNKHVCGKPGTPIKTKFAGEEVVIGVSSERQVGRVLLNELYKSVPGTDTYLNIDIGLIEINNINQWKTEIFSLGPISDIIDLNNRNISLNLVGKKVRGYGSVSGPIEGEIQALFYRYKSAGGFEYVSEFLIGSDDPKGLNIHHGDSGTILVYEELDVDTNGKWMTKYKPLGILWGKEDILTSKSVAPYALASSLSSALNLLEVELVKDWNIDLPYIWGKTGHYTVGNLAISCISDPDLASLMEKNVENISFELSNITADWDAKDKATKQAYTDKFKEFCPLADVPDIIWKQSRANKWGRQGDENPNHYIDADLPSKMDGNGAKTLLEYLDKKEKLTVANLTKYYDNVDMEAVGMTKPPSKGILPLRVWQVFNYMVQALDDGKIEKFVFGAGVLTHYVGDACQPLHSSYMSNGDPADDEEVTKTASRDSYHRNGEISHHKGDQYQQTSNPGNGVHAAYEDEMVDQYVDDIIAGLKKMIADKRSAINKEALPVITDGQSAGYAVIELLRKTQNEIHPRDIVETFKQKKDDADLIETLWNDFGDATIRCMARGARYQAHIWESAVKKSKLGVKKFKNTKFDTEKFRKDLKKLYLDRKELVSLHLDTIKDELT